MVVPPHAGKQGHMQAGCTEEPFCAKCECKGHFTALCTADGKPKNVAWVGFGVEGRGFFHVSIPEDKLAKPPSNSASVVIDKGNFTAEEVEEEFKELMDENWQWQVKQISPTEFTLVFPSKELLRMAMRGGGLLLPITGYRAAVSAVSGDPRASESLEVLWLKLWDVPEPLHDEKILLASTLELGCPLEVDLTSLGDVAGPVRMKFGCKALVQIKSRVTIFVNLQGFAIRVEQEVAGKAKGSLPSPPPPPNHKKDDDSEKDLPSSSEDGTVDSDSRKAREKRAKAKASSSGDKSKEGKGANRRRTLPWFCPCLRCLRWRRLRRLGCKFWPRSLRCRPPRWTSPRPCSPSTAPT